MFTEYKVWTHLLPKREDAPKLKRIWAKVRENERKYNSPTRAFRFWKFRRQLAHDYWAARKSAPRPTV